MFRAIDCVWASIGPHHYKHRRTCISQSAGLKIWCKSRRDLPGSISTSSRPLIGSRCSKVYTFSRAKKRLKLIKSAYLLPHSYLFNGEISVCNNTEFILYVYQIWFHQTPDVFPVGRLLNPLHPNIRMLILLAVLYTFPKMLTRRICLSINRFFKLMIVSFILRTFDVWFRVDIVRRS